MAHDIPDSRKELELHRNQLKKILAQARKLRENGAFAKVREALRTAEEIENDIGDLELRTRIRLELGLLELDGGNLEQDQSILKDVREVFIYLGKNEEVHAINKRLIEEG
ncbi:MAG TPA: hypothetical protein VI524_11790 [Anaerolineales bacterium]|nr:hypothetical protein [Anaerolineales bacterium]